VWLTDAADGRPSDAGSVDHDRDHLDCVGSSADGGDGPFVVVYMLDSFTYGTQAGDADDVNASRLATVGLLQCYSSMLRAIPDHLHSSIQLQVSVCCSYFWFILNAKLTVVCLTFIFPLDCQLISPMCVSFRKFFQQQASVNSTQLHRRNTEFEMYSLTDINTSVLTDSVRLFWLWLSCLLFSEHSRSLFLIFSM